MSRFVNPFPQFEDATPTMLSGAKLFFYSTGTSAKLNTYTTKALSVANPNPIVLNSAGRASVDIFLQDLEYKVVLAPSTDSDPPSSPIWTADPVSGRDSVLVAKTVTGSGSPNGSVAGTAGSAGILPDFSWDYTNLILYVCTTTGTSSTAVWTAINASTAAAVVPPPQGYLTLTTATPIITADVTAATAVYYTPYTGNTVPIYNGSSMIPTTFTELTLTLSSSHTASNIYDVFVFNNSGVPTIVTGPTWSAGTAGSITLGTCARGTGAGGAVLARVGGLYTNGVQITGRNGATTYTIAANLATYVGSIFMDGTNGQISCHRAYGQSRKWGVWNAYNRTPVYLKAGDGTASWSYGTNTLRNSNASANNNVTIFQGLAEEPIIVNFRQNITLTNSSSRPSVTMTTQSGIGVNAVLAFTANGTVAFNTSVSGVNTTAAGVSGNSVAQYDAPPVLGIYQFNCLEVTATATGDAFTYFGTEANMLLSALWRA